MLERCIPPTVRSRLPKSGRRRSMTTTHTPGPWRYVLGWPEPDTPEYQVLGDDDRTVTARTYSEDDARLIAQAPQMLAALKACADRLMVLDDRQGIASKAVYEPARA